MYVLLKSGDIPFSYVSLPESKCMISELQNFRIVGLFSQTLVKMGTSKFDGNIQV